MGQVATALVLAENALRRVGSYAPKDTGADPDHLSIALTALDAAVKELSGTLRAWWLIPSNVSLVLTAAENPIDIVAKSSAIVTGTFQFLFDAKISRSVGSGQVYDRDLKVITRREYNEIPDKDVAGYPASLYIDRTPLSPLVFLHPVPWDANFTIHITYQKYAADQTSKSGRVATGLDQAWERWADYQVASDIGDGPVARLPADELTRYERKAEIARTRLENFQNREANHPTIGAFRDF